MPASEATVETRHPGRYLTQLRKHVSKMGGRRLHQPRGHPGGGPPPEMRHAEWSGTDGTVTLNWGQWTVHAAPGTLTLRAEADSEENLQRIKNLVASRLLKFGRRERLTMNWQPAAPDHEPGRLPGDGTQAGCTASKKPNGKQPGGPQQLACRCRHPALTFFTAGRF